MKSSGIFIFGYMHCGTSLVQHILSKHPAIYCERKEIKFIEYLYRIKQLYPDIITPAKRQRFVAFCLYAIKNSLPVTSDFSRLPVDQYLVMASEVNTTSSDHLSVFFEVYAFLAHKSGCEFWLEGSPNSGFYHHQIRELCADAKFIVVVRDVRDVLASKKKRKLTTNEERYRRGDHLRRKKLEKHYSPVLDSLSWRNTYKNCAVLHDDPKTAVVRYEDLTRDPQEALKKLCSFLEVRFVPDLLDVNFKNNADLTISKTGIFSNSGNYSKQLLLREVAVSQAINEKLLVRYGYTIESIPFPSLIGSLFEWLKFGVHLVVRIWNRFRLLGHENFISFIRFNILKVRKGLNF